MTSRNFFKLIVLLATLVYLPHSLAQDTVDKFQIRTLTGPRPALHAVFSPDGQTFRTMAYIWDSEKEPGAAFIEIILWDVATGRQVSTFQSPMKLHFSSRIIAASLDGETLAYTAFSDIIEIIVWDVATGSEKRDALCGGTTQWH